MAKLTLDPVGNLNSAGLNTINVNSDRIEAAIENTLSRDGSTPNQMNSDLDMNLNDILNVGLIDAQDFSINGGESLQDILDQVAEAADEVLKLAASWKGPWILGTQYFMRDTVEYNGSSYIAVVDHIATTDNEPETGAGWEAAWDLVAARGFAGGIQIDATGTLAERAAYDAQPQGFAFLRTDVDPFELYVKASNTSGDWAGPTGLAGIAPRTAQFSGDAVTTVFVLPEDVGNTNQIDIYIDGVYQQKSEYTLVDDTITFTSAPPGDGIVDNIEVRYGRIVSTNSTSVIDGSITADSLTTSNSELDDIVEKLVYKLDEPDALYISIKDKLTRYIELEDFGADKTGVASSSDALREALQYQFDHPEAGPIFVNPGTYRFATRVNPPDGSHPRVIGAGRDLVTWTGAINSIPIMCRRTPGAGERLVGFHIEGITFDGQGVRTVFPYTDPATHYSGYGLIQSFNVRFKYDVRADVVIRNCMFKNIVNVPFWCANARGSVLIEGNIFERTKDAGILYCDNVRYVNNTVRFSADNGVSISRQNQKIHVANNTIFGTGSLGIFVGGIDLAQTMGITLTGATYTAGSTLTATLTGVGEGWTTEDIDVNVTLTSGASSALCRVISVQSATSATLVAVLNVPAALQAIQTTTWSIGPQAGSQFGSVNDNTVICSAAGGIWGSLGTSNLRVHDNTIIGSGMQIDSEVSTYGTVLSGSTTLNVTSGTGFTIGSWVAMIPDRTNDEPFFAEITNVVGNVITLGTAAPKSLINTELWRAQRNSGSSIGILFSGLFYSQQYLHYNEGINIHDNYLLDCVNGGIRMGSSSGSARRSRIMDNTIRYNNNQVATTTAFGISIIENDVNMRMSNIRIKDNTILMPTGSSTTGVRVQPIDTSATSMLQLEENFIQADQIYSVIEQTGLTDQTSLWNVSNLKTRPARTLMVSELYSFDEHVSGTIVSNNLVITGSSMVVNPGATATVNTFSLPGTASHRPWFILRNVSANTVTLTHNSSNIRCPNGADVTLGANEAALIFAVDSTTWQVLGY